MRRFLPVAAIAMLAACAAEPATAPAVVTAPTVQRGSGQFGAPGYLLADSLEVRVVDANGEPVRGATVTWETQPSHGVVTAGAPTTDANGVVRASWRMPFNEGTHWASARVGSLPAANFTSVTESAVLNAAGGTADALCGLTTLGMIRCFRPPQRDSVARSEVVPTSDRFSTMAFARDRWCAVTATGRIICFTMADLYRTGRFAPAQALPSLLTSFGPKLTILAAAADAEAEPVFCGLTGDGEAWCWGNNATGQLGVGTRGGVAELPAKVIATETFRDIDVSRTSTCALTVSGEPWCWGSNATALIGSTAGLGEYLVPQRVSTGYRFFDMALTASGTGCGIRSSGQVVCWGHAGRDALGRVGVVADDPVPTPVSSDNIFVSIEGNGSGFSAVSIDRELVIWGAVPNATSTDGRGFTTPTRIFFDERFTGLLRGGTVGFSCMRSLVGGARCVDIYVLGPAALREAGSTARPAQFGVPLR